MNRRTLLKYTGLSIPTAFLSPLLRAQRQEPAEQKNKEMKIQRLSWAGLKIELDGTTLYIDAIYGDAAKDIPLLPKTKAVHALITHHHSDHFDPAALKTVFGESSTLYCHDSVLPWIDARNFKIQPLHLYQPVDVSKWKGDLVAIPVPAVDGFGHPQVSWIVQGGGKKIIHCGDTLWHGYWQDIARAYGPFDVAFMPINAARINQGVVKDTGIACVMNPEQAVVASQLLQAKRVCPIHYGRPGATYFETPDPEGQFIKSAKERKADYIILKEGDVLPW
ncbi:MAG TPA: MBL fold metallo-hydrolase [Chitinophagaceae bacterium]|nr:MBL fold metallo-hydrolase [Chitinophagaceae bacterium]